MGKTWIACALTHSACRNGYSASYRRLARLLTELAIARADGRYAKRLASIAKTRVLVIDDWGVSKLSAENRRDLLEIIEDRHGLSSTIVTSQLPVKSWHAVIGEGSADKAFQEALRSTQRSGMWVGDFVPGSRWPRTGRLSGAAVRSESAECVASGGTSTQPSHQLVELLRLRCCRPVVPRLSRSPFDSSLPLSVRQPGGRAVRVRSSWSPRATRGAASRGVEPGEIGYLRNHVIEEHAGLCRRLCVGQLRGAWTGTRAARSRHRSRVPDTSRCACANRAALAASAATSMPLVITSTIGIGPLPPVTSRRPSPSPP